MGKKKQKRTSRSSKAATKQAANTSSPTTAKTAEQPTAPRLKDADVESALSTGAHAGILEDYFGAEEYQSPMPAPAPVKDPRAITYIVNRARNDLELTRVLVALLTLCHKHIEDDD